MLNVRDANALNLGTVDARRDLIIVSSAVGGQLRTNSGGGAIAQSGPLRVSGQSTLVAGAAAAGTNNSAGIVIDLREAPVASAAIMAAVCLPRGTATLGTGFQFELPAGLRAQLPSGAQVQASLPDGGVLPTWLKFDAQTMRFEATAVPSGAFPLQVAVQVGGQRVLMVISERTE